MKGGTLEAVHLLKSHKGEIGRWWLVISSIEWLCIWLGATSIQLLTTWIFSLLTLCCACLDAHYKRLLNPLVMLLFTLGGVRIYIDGSVMTLDSLLGALVCGGILLAIKVISPGGMGTGDVKFGAALGMWLAPDTALVALYIAFVSGVLYVLLRWLKDGNELWIGGGFRKTEIPFGPFLALGGGIALLFGDSIIRIYLLLF